MMWGTVAELPGVCSWWCFQINYTSVSKHRVTGDRSHDKVSLSLLLDQGQTAILSQNEHLQWCWDAKSNVSQVSEMRRKIRALRQLWIFCPLKWLLGRFLRALMACLYYFKGTPAGRGPVSLAASHRPGRGTHSSGSPGEVLPEQTCHPSAELTCCSGGGRYGISSHKIFLFPILVMALLEMEYIPRIWFLERVLQRAQCSRQLQQVTQLVQLKEWMKLERTQRGYYWMEMEREFQIMVHNPF